MSTTPQKVIVNGELQVICTTVTGETRGAIRFIDASGNQFGQMRAWGQYPFARLIIDSAGMSSGCAFKMKTTQGAQADGGSGEKYSLEVGSYGIYSTYLELYPPTRNLSINIRENGQAILSVGRGGTKDYTPVYSYLSRFTQSEFKTNENVGFLSVGRASGTNAVWGLVTPGGPDPTLDYFYLAGATSTSVIPTISMTWNTTGNVTFPHKITADTIHATNYENLPPASVLPITLDPANNQVGINQTTPAYSLDVTGSLHVTDGTGMVRLQNGQLLYQKETPTYCEAIFDCDNVFVNNGNLSVDQNIYGQGDAYIKNNLTFGTVAGLQPAILHGSGVPSTASDVGSLYLRQDGGTGTCVYVKEPTAWVPLGGGGSGSPSTLIGSPDIFYSTGATFNHTTTFTGSVSSSGEYKLLCKIIAEVVQGFTLASTVTSLATLLTYTVPSCPTSIEINATNGTAYFKPATYVVGNTFPYVYGFTQVSVDNDISISYKINIPVLPANAVKFTLKMYTMKVSELL